MRARLREGKINISEEFFFPAFYHGHRRALRTASPRTGFLKSRLLVLVSCFLLFSADADTVGQTFLVIFTSPGSGKTLGAEREDGGPIPRSNMSTGTQNGTKPNVANLLDMDCEVTPRSIAYAAVLVCFFFLLPFLIIVDALQVAFQSQ